MKSPSRCPECRKQIEGQSQWYPFCSERCKMLDLGAWATEKYRIPTDEKQDDQSNGAVQKNLEETD